MVREKYIERDGKRYKLVRKGKYVEVNKTKSHRFLATKILSVFFVLFVAAPLGVTFGLFYDSSTKDVNAVTDENITDTLSNRLFRSINHLKELSEEEEKILTLNFDDQTLDSILMQANHQFLKETPVGDYIPKFYCTIDGNKYNFYADIQSGFFKTRAAIKTTLEKVNKEDPTLKFTIDSIDLGRLGIKTGFIGSIVSNFISADTINKVLENTHFSAKFDFNSMSLTYPRSQFSYDVDYWLRRASEQFPEMNLVFKMIGASKDSIETDYTNGVKVDLNLEKFATGTDIPESVDVGLNLKETVKGVTNIVTNDELVTEKTVDEAKEALVEYINYGYDNISEDKQKLVDDNKQLIVDNFEEKIPTVEEVTTYEGVIKKEDTSENLISSEDIEKFIAKESTPLVIKPTDFNKYLNNFKIIGKTVQLSTGTSSSLNNTYVSLNNFGFGVDNGQLCCFIGADLTGALNINTRIPISEASIKDGKISIKIDSSEGAIKIGSISVDAETISSICSKFNIDGSVFSYKESEDKTSGEFLIAYDELKGISANSEIDTTTGNITLTRTK